MVNVSRKYLREDIKAEVWRRLKEEISKNKDLEKIFKKFFTPSEIIMIEKRLAILVMLDSKSGYLEIRRLLDVSPGTVSFIKQGFKIKKRPIKKSKWLIPIGKIKESGRKFPRYKGSRGFGLSEW